MRNVYVLLLLMSTLHAEIDPHKMYLFYREPGGRTVAMERAFDSVAERMGTNALPVKVYVNDPGQFDLVDQFQLRNAPMPHAVVVAANGAVTGSFRSAVTEQQLLDAFSGQATASCLKGLQNGKFVLLCMPNGSSKAMRGVRDLASDKRFSKKVELVVVDPKESCEKKLLQRLGIDASNHKPLTVLLAPPTQVIGVYEGATTKDQFLADLELAGKI